MASNYFIKGKVIGKKGDGSYEFTEVFGGVDNAKLAYDNYVAAIRTKKNRIPQDIDVTTFNKV
jgi:hypothetical protein